MNIEEGAEVRLILVGRQVVMEPADDTLDDVAFRRRSQCCAVTGGPSGAC
jgi:hypothetical protein